MRIELCNLSLHVHFCKLCFSSLIDQPGVATFACTHGSVDLVYILEAWFAYVVAKSILYFWFASRVLRIRFTRFRFANFVRIFSLGELAM